MKAETLQEDYNNPFPLNINHRWQAVRDSSTEAN